MEIRKADPSDIKRIMEIYSFARHRMAENGNPTQWGSSYPPIGLIERDIAASRSYVICGDDIIHGVFYLAHGDDPTYKLIEDGQWLNDEPYVTIHRVAGDGQAHGIFRAAADFAKAISANIRIDTHRDNHIMQGALTREGFRKCGRIYTESGSPRIAYQWCRDI